MQKPSVVSSRLRRFGLRGDKDQWSPYFYIKKTEGLLITSRKQRQQKPVASVRETGLVPRSSSHSGQWSRRSSEKMVIVVYIGQWRFSSLPAISNTTWNSMDGDHGYCFCETLR